MSEGLIPRREARRERIMRPVEWAVRMYLSRRGWCDIISGGHWRDICEALEAGRVRSFLAMLKNSAVSFLPALSVMVAPARL
jgi:hypothetical protein